MISASPPRLGEENPTTEDAETDDALSGRVAERFILDEIVQRVVASVGDLHCPIGALRGAEQRGVCAPAGLRSTGGSNPPGSTRWDSTSVRLDEAPAYSHSYSQLGRKWLYKTGWPDDRRGNFEYKTGPNGSLRTPPTRTLNPQ
jgi:hypothetical protein